MPEEKKPLVETRGKFVIYRMNFDSLHELEHYLLGNPKVNTKIFKSLKSEYLSEDFAGEKLEKAINYCHGGYRKEFDRFLLLKKKLDSVYVKKSHGRRTVSSFVGSRPNVAAYVAGVPKNMYRIERVKEKKFIDIYMNLAYSGETTDEQILNRGILTLNLISIFEASGLGVNLFVFEASHLYDEVFITEIKLKKYGEITNVGKCYYPLCGKEFIRRVLARVKESMPFKEKWNIGYGASLPESIIRDILHINSNAFLISTPEEMGIKGYDIFEDADAFLEKLNLTDRVSVPRYRDFNDREK